MFKIISRHQNGFTIIEIIVVIVILGIASAYVAKSSMGLIEESDYITQINQLRNHLKYAQVKSINSADHWGIDFSGSQYALFSWQDSDPGTRIYHFFPGSEKIVSEDPLAKGTVGITEPATDKYWTTNLYVWFDALGRAYTIENYSDAVSTENDITGTCSIVCLGGQSGASVIQIEQKTGYILCDYQ